MSFLYPPSATPPAPPPPPPMPPIYANSGVQAAGAAQRAAAAAANGGEGFAGTLLTVNILYSKNYRFAGWSRDESYLVVALFTLLDGVTASALAMSREPMSTPSAPSIRAAARPRPSAMPPAARSKHSGAAPAR